MSALIKIKSSTVADKVPASLAPAELAVNLTDQKLYTADVDGNVFELGTTGGAIPSPTPPSNPNEGDLWFDSDNDTLNFWDGSQWVELGEASASGVVSVNTKVGVVVLDADDVGAVATTGKAGQSVEGSLNVEGKVTSASTAAGDPGTTLVTKDFVDGGGGGTGDIGFWNRTGTDLSPVNSGDNLDDVGSITAAGAVSADDFFVRNGADIKGYFQADGNRAWISSDGTTDLGFDTNGLERLNISGSDGTSHFTPDVGIGGTSAAPNIELKADGNITAAGFIDAGGTWPALSTGRFENGRLVLNPDGGNALSVWNDRATNSSETVEITASGNITAAGSGEFGGDWANDASPQIRNFIGGSVGSVRVKGSTSAGSGSNAFGVYKGGNDVNSQVFGVAYDGSIIAAGGLFEVGGNGGLEIYRQTTTGTNSAFRVYSDVGGTKEQKISFQTDGSITAAGDVGIGGTSAAPNIELKTNGNAYFQGQIGIGTDLPVSALDVHSTSGKVALIKSTGNNTGRLYLSSQNCTDDNQVAIAAINDGCQLWAGGESKVRIHPNGRVGIGKDDPTAKLDVDGTVRATAFDLEALSPLPA